MGGAVHEEYPRDRARGARRRLTPLRIVLLYAAIGFAWILLSDRGLALLVPDEERREALQTRKGVAYVFATAAVLYYLIRRHERERRVHEQEVRSVLYGMADAVLVLDARGEIVDANQAAAALLGAHHPRDLLRPGAALASAVELRGADGQPLPLDESVVRRALGTEEVTRSEARFRAFDGRDVLVSVTTSPVRARPDGRVHLVVVVLRDIGEARRLEDMRDEFLATAAHELRTPLAVVKAHAQLMARRRQGDPTALEAIARQTDRLTRIVQQLVEVSRMRGGAELSRERFDLGPLLVESAAAASRATHDHRIAVDAPITAPVLGDRDRIGHVISTLLDNAVRFSPRGGDVEVSLASVDAEAVVCVRDHGVGIPLERQARVFERYYRAHAGTAEDYGGLGVSLDVSREIIARHGGRIWFESTPGRGSAFSFSLPLAREERA